MSNPFTLLDRLHNAAKCGLTLEQISKRFNALSKSDLENWMRTNGYMKNGL